MRKKKFFSPITWPVMSFIVAIFIGGILLSLSFASAQGHRISVIDAFFLATSAVCVTGLDPVNVSESLSPIGQGILLMLIQLGGLGITTYTSLVFVLWRNRVPIADRDAVHQALLNKDIVNVRSFLWQLVLLVMGIELFAAFMLYLHDPINFHPFSAIFHSISAFCNAGFTLFPDNLISFKDDVTVNSIIGISIVLGGLGFAVLHEISRVLRERIITFTQKISSLFKEKPKPKSIYSCHDTLDLQPPKRPKLDRYSRLVLKTTLVLIIGGGAIMFGLEILHARSEASFSLALSSVFQSISARTAGFNSINMGTLSDASMLIMVLLMFIGGAPGSCAGGIKITTFRVLLGFMKVQVNGEKDVVVQERAIRQETIGQALMLFFFGALTIGLSVLMLCVTENASLVGFREGQVRLLAVIFEVVSAFGTVGYTLDLTPNLSFAGKIIIILNMFIGRVGYIGLLTAVHSLQPSRKYSYPAMNIPIG